MNSMNGVKFCHRFGLNAVALGNSHLAQQVLHVRTCSTLVELYCICVYVWLVCLRLLDHKFQMKVHFNILQRWNIQVSV